MKTRQEEEAHVSTDEDLLSQKDEPMIAGPQHWKHRT